MGRSQKWPDLRSPISKIRDIRFVGTDHLIIFWKFHKFPRNIVAVARLESYFVVGSLDLTWWPDLTWHWVEIFTKVAEKMGGKVGENPAALRAAVFSLSSKNLRGGGRSNAPPPSRARVNLTRLPVRRSINLTRLPLRRSVNLTRLPVRRSINLTRLPVRRLYRRLTSEEMSLRTCRLAYRSHRKWLDWWLPRHAPVWKSTDQTVTEIWEKGMHVSTCRIAHHSHRAWSAIVGLCTRGWRHASPWSLVGVDTAVIRGRRDRLRGAEDRLSIGYTVGKI